MNIYIEVKNLGYSINNIRILNCVSFSVEKGQILGLIGANGAGKSTTMRCIAGILKFQQGEIKIMGSNVLDNPELTKTRFGYLAEQNPLYTNMYVKEYLSFMAKLKGINKKQIANSVNSLMQKCSLNSVKNKKIKELSKGFKQRIGIAGAIIQDPPVLILDEPTSGLDPKQIIEIRNLIKDISINKAIIISTHIMQEVKFLCSKITFIESGNVKLSAEIKDINCSELEQLFCSQKQ